MSSGDVSISELWIKLRGCENAFRYYSDVLFAVGAELEKRGLVPSGGVPTHDSVAHALRCEFSDPMAALSRTPVKCPPWCGPTSDGILAGLDELDAIVDAALSISKTFVVTLKDSTGGTGVFDAYVTETPGTHWTDHESH